MDEHAAIGLRQLSMNKGKRYAEGRVEVRTAGIGDAYQLVVVAEVGKMEMSVEKRDHSSDAEKLKRLLVGGARRAEVEPPRADLIGQAEALGARIE